MREDGCGRGRNSADRIAFAGCIGGVATEIVRRWKSKRGGQEDGGRERKGDKRENERERKRDSRGKGRDTSASA